MKEVASKENAAATSQKYYSLLSTSMRLLDAICSMVVTCVMLDCTSFHSMFFIFQIGYRITFIACYRFLYFFGSNNGEDGGASYSAIATNELLCAILFPAESTPLPPPSQMQPQQQQSIQTATTPILPNNTYNSASSAVTNKSIPEFPRKANSFSSATNLRRIDLNTITTAITTIVDEANNIITHPRYKTSVYTNARKLFEVNSELIVNCLMYFIESFFFFHLSVCYLRSEYCEDFSCCSIVFVEGKVIRNFITNSFTFLFFSTFNNWIW